MKFCPAGGTIVEVGCWKGKSSAFLVVESINAQKNIKVFCVDTWEGNDEIPINDSDMNNKTVFEKIMKNMSPVLGHFNIVRSPSIDAAKKFEDESLDVVFIDASHHYVDVMNDILSWWPKIKKGGILSGHDIQIPDVIRAVNETLVNWQHAGEQCWIKVK